MANAAKQIERIGRHKFYEDRFDAEGMSIESQIATGIATYALFACLQDSASDNLMLILHRAWNLFSSAVMGERSFALNFKRFRVQLSRWEVLKDSAISEIPQSASYIFTSNRDLKDYMDAQADKSLRGARAAAGIDS